MSIIFFHIGEFRITPNHKRAKIYTNMTAVLPCTHYLESSQWTLGLKILLEEIENKYVVEEDDESEYSDEEDQEIGLTPDFDFPEDVNSEYDADECYEADYEYPEEEYSDNYSAYEYLDEDQPTMAELHAEWDNAGF